ncbi:hypothetical protein HPP92_023782 [Vanilla planifolia]|uniref:Uncharacterized protein n=1 Tax=Vanilla planifolia TaxID=51239 RepID=A0A835PII3_VANPL|nr:hypothetical protein HPP92_023782 [Vanilla planifolia]
MRNPNNSKANDANCAPERSRICRYDDDAKSTDDRLRDRRGGSFPLNLIESDVSRSWVRRSPQVGLGVVSGKKY